MVKKRVVMVTPWNIHCGIGDYTKKLLRVLSKKHPISIIGSDNPQTKNPFYFIGLARKANKNSDIIHIQHEFALFGKLFVSGIYIPLFYLFLDKKKKIITSIHELGELPGLRGMLRRFFLRQTFKNSDIIHVHTPLGASYVERIGAPKEKIVQIPLGMFDHKKALDKNASKKRLGLEGKKVILHLGFINKIKGHDTLITSLAKVKKGVALIAGISQDDLFLNDLKELIKKHNLGSRVIFYGKYKDEELPILLSAADIAVMPYTKATQSSIIDLFLTYSLPTITSSLPSFRFLEKRYGCIMTYSNEDDFARKINDIVEQKKLKNSLQKGIQNYQHERNAQKITAQIINLYEN